MTAESFGDRARRLRAEHGRKMAKYFAGSIAATLVSTGTFMGTFGPGLLGSKSASLAASATGAVTNYFLNRNWTWERRGRASFRRELLPYWATVVTTALVAALVTGGVNAIVRHYSSDRTLRTLINTCAFLAVYGGSFLVKYRLFDRLFAGNREAAATETGPVDSVPDQAVRVSSAASPRD